MRPALLAALVCVSCSRTTEQGSQTIAILPFENLSASPELDWMSRGFAESLRLQLSGTRRWQPVLITAMRDAGTAARVVHGYFSIDGGRLRVHADVEDPASRRMERSSSFDAPLAQGIPAPARALAHLIDPQARDFPAKSNAAFKAYTDAISASDTEVADAAFERAVVADPSFGAAYLGWAQALFAHGDRTRAAKVLSAAGPMVAKFPELERSRLAVLAATVAGSRSAQRQALIALAHSEPADTSVYRALGELETLDHAYAEAAKWYEQALAQKPGDLAVLNQIGYVRAWAGDLTGATKALTAYRDRAPKDANPLDSLGDAHYYNGRFAEAEKYYEQAQATDANALGGGELYKAAWARLMQGDRAGADAIFARYLEASPAARAIAPYRQALWDYVSGRRKQAFARLEDFARNAQPPLASLALSQLSLWSLDTGDRERARQYAAKSPMPTVLTAVCAFASAPPVSAAEWKTRAERLFPQPGQEPLRRTALIYAYLLSKDFASAIPLLQELYGTVAPSSAEWPAIPLGWALAETGDMERAAAMVAHTPVPDPSGQLAFLSLSFPRVFYLRGLTAEKQNHREEARANYKLFLQFAGDLPDVFREKDRASEALARL